MKKQLLLVLAIGILVVIFGSFAVKKNNTKSNEKINKKSELVGKLETNSENYYDSSDKIDLSKLNGEENPDNFKFEEILNNYFRAEKTAVLENDILFMSDFIEEGSKYEQDMLIRIQGLQSKRTEDIIEYIMLDDVEKDGEKYIIKTKISIDGIENNMDCILIKINETYKIIKMNMYDENMNLIYQMG